MRNITFKLINDLVKLGGIIFQRVFFYIADFDAQNAFSESDFDDIADFYIVRGFCISAVDLYMLGVTCAVGDRPSFDNPRDL